MTVQELLNELSRRPGSSQVQITTTNFSGSDILRVLCNDDEKYVLIVSNE